MAVKNKIEGITMIKLKERNKSYIITGEDDMDETALEIQDLYVPPKLRGKGEGSRLIRKTIDYAKKMVMRK